MRRRLNDISSSTTGQPIEKIERDMDRDDFMSAESTPRHTA